MLHLLDSEPGLRRALADPSKPADEKGAIVVALLHGKVTPAAEELAAATVRAQWAGPADMTDALEQLAVETFAIAAEESGQLDDLEDELFRFNRVVASEPELRAALTEPALPAAGKQRPDQRAARRQGDAGRTAADHRGVAAPARPAAGGQPGHVHAYRR